MSDFSRVRVLVVDDSSIWRKFLIEYLCDVGLRAIDVAYDGVEAAYKARTLKLDLILMDVALPHMNGIEAAAVIRKVAPAAKILFVSGNNDPEVKRAALHAGGLDYILKPLAGRDLVPAIRLALSSPSA